MNIKIKKGSNGGDIIKKVSQLLENRDENGYEIVTLVSGLLALKVPLCSISIEEDTDSLTLHYAVLRLARPKRLTYKWKYTLH